MTDPFHDRIALVTGAASGLGVAFCDAFVARGARLIMVDIHAERLAVEVARHGEAVVDSAVLVGSRKGVVGTCRIGLTAG